VININSSVNTTGKKTDGKTPKKLDSICCPQHREIKADTLKQLRPIGEEDQELEKNLVLEKLTDKITHMYRKSM
jgi:hypothetical protein